MSQSLSFPCCITSDRETLNNFLKPLSLLSSKIWISLDTVSRCCCKLVTIKVHQNSYLTFRTILKYLHFYNETKYFAQFLSSSELWDASRDTPDNTRLSDLPATSVGNSSSYFLLGHGMFFNTLLLSHG